MFTITIPVFPIVATILAFGLFPLFCVEHENRLLAFASTLIFTVITFFITYGFCAFVGFI